MRERRLVDLGVEDEERVVAALLEQQRDRRRERGRPAASGHVDGGGEEALARGEGAVEGLVA